MAERLVSPGVFTRERDLSFLTQGISEIGGAFIGATGKGPAFIPTIVRSQNEFQNRFGVPNEDSYLGYTVMNYLQESGVATIVRVLGLDGYSGSATVSALLYITGSGGKHLLGAFHPNISGSSLTNVAVAGTSASFSLVLSASGASPVSASSLSADSGSTNFFHNAFGTDPKNKKNAYMYATFPDAYTSASASSTLIFTTSSVALDFAGVEYSNASTPWIMSQTVGGTRQDLFKIHTLSDGVASNKDVKVSIVAVKPSTVVGEYGTFGLLIREATDTDSKPIILEQWDNLDINPDSANYIARRIGDSAPYTDSETGEIYYQGDFKNNSQYIRIEMVDGILGIPAEALPYGYRAIYSPVIAQVGTIPEPRNITTRWRSGSFEGYTAGAVPDVKKYYGFDYTETNLKNQSFLAPLPNNAFTVGSDFSMENLPANEYDGTDPISITDTAHLNLRKFTVPFQGGFDGFAPNIARATGGAITTTNTQGFNCSTSTSSGTVAYAKAINSLSNGDDWDFNLLVLPGIIYSLHGYVAQLAIDLCETRGDAFCIIDLEQLTATVNSVVNTATLVDTNYAAAYYPWVRILDTNTNKIVWAPPSVVMPEVYAYNDNVAEVWFAPAGLNRGGVPGAIGVKSKLTQASRDTLYEGKVNPIASFNKQGIAVWGQKTLQRVPSALDRINVRRLIIEVKKYIASTARYLVFEQNVEATRNRFLNIVNPYLASVQERYGLYAFKVIMDETNNTPDIIDRNILYGQLYLQPTKTAEFILLDFNVLPTGAVFPTA
jgi:hypothetical protein